MRCEICDRLILNNRYKKFTDARSHYLHQTCFDVFSNAGIKPKPRRKIKKNTGDSPKVKLFEAYEDTNPYQHIKP